MLSLTPNAYNKNKRLTIRIRDFRYMRLLDAVDGLVTDYYLLAVYLLQLQ